MYLITHVSRPYGPLLLHFLPTIISFPLITPLPNGSASWVAFLKHSWTAFARDKGSDGMWKSCSLGTAELSLFFSFLFLPFLFNDAVFFSSLPLSLSLSLLVPSLSSSLFLSLLCFVLSPLLSSLPLILSPFFSLSPFPSPHSFSSLHSFSSSHSFSASHSFPHPVSSSHHSFSSHHLLSSSPLSPSPPIVHSSSPVTFPCSSPSRWVIPSADSSSPWVWFGIGYVGLVSNADSSHRYMFSSICLGAQTSSMIPERPGSALYQRALHRVGGIGGTSAGRTFVCVAHEMEDI